MKYDFTTVYDRRGMDALAVDALGQPGGFAPGKPKDGFSVIPMWVADMNFACDFIARHFPGVPGCQNLRAPTCCFWTALTGALP